jgi:hypothetical protein
MTMITGQLGASDPRKDQFVALADEGGINATLWFGIESVIVQVDKAGAISLVYDDGRGQRKGVFHSFMWELAATTGFASTEPDGTMRVE